MGGPAAVAPERRRFTRERRRIACILTWRGARCSGWIRDWSANGLAVDAQVCPRLGDPVDVELRAGNGLPITLTTQVVRIQRSHPSARTVVPQTLGLQIGLAPEDYFQLLMGED
jgi:hypothetical protein